jgi:acetoin utilization protein AcuB
MMMRDCMTPAPYSVRKEHAISIAQRLMVQKDIRHLPVLDATGVVGVLSERNIRQALSSGEHPDRVTVEQAMTRHPYQVPPTAALVDVVQKMAEAKYGSALVVENGRTRGIFTTVDALRLLARLMMERTA